MLIVQICVGSSCYLKGSADIVELFEKNIEAYNLDSLRKLVRDLEKENKELRKLLDKAEIPYFYLLFLMIFCFWLSIYRKLLICNSAKRFCF